MAAVIKVEFSQDGATLVSADGRETFLWDLATGARKDQVAGEQVAFAEAGIGTKAGIGRYIVSKSIGHEVHCTRHSATNFQCLTFPRYIVSKSIVKCSAGNAMEMSSIGSSWRCDVCKTCQHANPPLRCRR